MILTGMPQVDTKDPVTGADVRAFLDLSTAHFTGNDNKVLAHMAAYNGVRECPLYVYDQDQGFLVFVVGADSEWLYTGRQKMLTLGLSLAFVELVTYARARGYNGIWFDADAAICRYFPIFDWERDDEVSPPSVTLNAQTIMKGAGSV